MAKLLVNAPTGEQQIIEVGVGGGYYDASRVLWDERVDGPLPEVQLGGMVRVGGALNFDGALYTASVNVSIFKANKIKETKTEAFRRILLVLPSGTTADNYHDKELNLLARSDELHRIVSGTFINEYGSLENARSLTVNEVAELTTFSLIWSRIKAIRFASNSIETDIAASVDPENFDVADPARWPA